ncbi:hypothetical protein [Chelativorans salis]|uniref:Uncharacterized protein n=1 Tax=Chelativorans salis TaxID=2978478 RepID=A0ABT2LJD4_9HYPH|nr:hypothetical protein [Chelativorans sp. EGI FJ00035]MCT7374341.1 hypothetical protein [Chelativorans sp. EGI FJ00035]
MLTNEPKHALTRHLTVHGWHGNLETVTETIGPGEPKRTALQQLHEPLKVLISP